MRNNPYLNTNYKGELSNPQFSPWARDDGLTSTLWVHSTEEGSSPTWELGPFIPQGKRFYLSGGATGNSFGRNLFFFRYKPRKIFDFDDIDASFLEVVYKELSFASKETLRDFQNLYGVEPFDSKENIFDALEKRLNTGNYSYFETPYIQNALIKEGYTAYYESEGYSGIETPWSSINLAVMSTDFDRLTLVAVALGVHVESGVEYRCTNCSCLVSPDSIIQGTLGLNDGQVMCLECSKMETCTLCEKRAPYFEDYETNSWGDIETAICSSCFESRRCDSCEDYFEESELREFKESYSTYLYCQECYENEIEDDDDESRDNPYPYFVDCQDAMGALWDEVNRQDIQQSLQKMVQYVQRMLPHSQHPLNPYRVPEDIAWFHKLRRISSARELSDFYLQIWQREDSVVVQAINVFAPPAVLMREFSIVENVEFLHFVPKYRAASIKSQGLYGRATPSRLTATRLIPDVQIKGNGFIFAYEPNLITNETVVFYTTQVRGIASQALKLYYIADEEYQLIVPIKCIEQKSLVIEPNPIYAASPFLAQRLMSDEEDQWQPYLAQPKDFELGSMKQCGSCGTSFHLSLDNLPEPEFGYATRGKFFCLKCKSS